jgi:hypothetical protein
MTQYAASEVVVGAVIFLDPDVLRLGGSALTTAPQGKAVKDRHYFVVLSVNGSQVILAPVYSDNPKGLRSLLDAGLKTGSEVKWIGSNSYLDGHQHWSADVSDVCTASSVDATSPGSRNGYGGAASLAANVPHVGAGTWRSLHANVVRVSPT